MRKILFLMSSICLLTMGTSAQTLKRYGNIKYIMGMKRLEYQGQFFKLKEDVVTVKLKADKALTEDLKVSKGNRLGYIDVAVPEGVDIVAFVENLEKTGNYEIVEYNSYGSYNDIMSANAPGINRQWYLKQINVNAARQYASGKPNIIVGVLDSGTDWMHPDLGLGEKDYKNIFVNAKEDDWSDHNDPASGNKKDDDYNGYMDDRKGWNFGNNSNNVITDVSHGTQVAGIVSGKADSPMGMMGIAGGKDSEGVKILPVCLGASAPDGSVIDDAIIYATDMGARVIQLSLCVVQSNAMDAAINYAVSKGVLVVCASGSGAKGNVNYPASNENVLSVGGTDKNNRRASFANYGTSLDVVAPAVDIYSTTVDNTYASADGTSFAAAQVSGIAALIFSANPALTGREVRNIIEKTTKKTSGYSYRTTSGRLNGAWNNEMGYGLVDAHGAVLAAHGALASIANYHTIAGDKEIVAYAILNCPPNATIMWQAGDNLILSSGQGTSTASFRTSANSGYGTVKAVVTANGKTLSLENSKMWIGTPKTGLLNICDDYNCSYFPVFQNTGSAHLTMNAVGKLDEDSDGWEWEKVDGCFTINGEDRASGRSAYISQTSPGAFSFKIRAKNKLGWGDWKTVSWNVTDKTFDVNESISSASAHTYSFSTESPVRQNKNIMNFKIQDTP